MKFGVIGLGRFGCYVATTLADNGAEVLAVDSNEAAVAAIQDKVTQAVCMAVTDEEALRSIGMEEMGTVIVAMGENFAQSILVTALLKQNLKVPRVIARAVSPIHRDILVLIGADQIILPEKEEGIRLADRLSLHFKALMRLGSDAFISRLTASKKLSGKTIDYLRDTYHVTCIGIEVGEEIIPISSNSIIVEGETLIISGKNDDLERIAKL